MRCVLLFLIKLRMKWKTLRSLNSDRIFHVVQVQETSSSTSTTASSSQRNYSVIASATK